MSWLCDEDSLLCDASFQHCFRGVISWYLSSLEYDRDGQNFVTVDDNSLSIHDSRGSTHTYSYYFIKKMHDIIDHASNIFAQERLGKVLIGPRVVSSMTASVKFSDREAKPR
eukprot:scaffold51340_cov62-Attheya_sp.AAC.1